MDQSRPGGERVKDVAPRASHHADAFIPILHLTVPCLHSYLFFWVQVLGYSGSGKGQVPNGR